MQATGRKPSCVQKNWDILHQQTQQEEYTLVMTTECKVEDIRPARQAPSSKNQSKNIFLKLNLL